MPNWPRTVRLHERWIITERINGTRAAILIKAEHHDEPAGPGRAKRPLTVQAASGTRWLVPEPEARCGVGRDNFGFAAWADAHAAELGALGPGVHRGVWYGSGIGSGYRLAGRRFALVDTARWQKAGLPAGVPESVMLVPVLAECEGAELNAVIAACLACLVREGSVLVPGAAAAGVVARSAADPRFLIEAAMPGAGRPLA